ncbi:MAG TPA: NAD(P)-dependent oxidoreductase [Planctomycetaceae bacterium]|nr:NAD(P)-dependent oxidoreductase [Planctomycetaceae bacterium]
MGSNYWHQKTCVVTGSSAGLGLAIARALAQKQAKIVLVGRREEPLQQAVVELSPTATDVAAVVADVTCPEDVHRLHQSVMEQFGPIDMLCNCAGRSARQHVLETSIDEFQQLMEINFLAAVRTTQAFAPSLLERRGHVVNIGSLASKVAPRFLGGYPASKFALAAFSQQLRLELGPQGLHTLLVCPGPIRRDSNAPRYEADSKNHMPASAQQPGAGAKLRGIDPDWLAHKILHTCEHRRLELVVPRKVRLLLTLAQFSPRLGDWLLLKATS